MESFEEAVAIPAKLYELAEHEFVSVSDYGLRDAVIVSDGHYLSTVRKLNVYAELSLLAEREVFFRIIIADGLFYIRHV
jgi:hypothetical protein